ncbi:hypothetical protein H311_03037 [Anncaliia algerae PRA109]|nr:hypothetical protein H311_03037 [Anncaliia algerae PRA109]
MQQKEEADKIHSTETLCYNCNKMGETQVITLPYSSMPTEVIHAFFCPHCNTRDVGFFDKETEMHKKLIITCKFQSKDDLQRYAFLQEGSKIFFYKGRRILYKYEVPTSTVMVIEMFLTSLIRKIAEMINVDPTEELVFSEENEESNNLESKEENEEDKYEESKDREILLKKIAEIKHLRNTGSFKLVIHDEKGKSRVGLKDQQCPDQLYCAHFADLNDGIVEHKYPKKRREE